MPRKIVFSPAQLHELYADRDLFTAIMDEFSHNTAVTVVQAFVSAKSAMRQHKLLFPETPLDRQFKVDESTGDLVPVSVSITDFRNAVKLQKNLEK